MPPNPFIDDAAIEGDEDDNDNNEYEDEPLVEEQETVASHLQDGGKFI